MAGEAGETLVSSVGETHVGAIVHVSVQTRSFVLPALVPSMFAAVQRASTGTAVRRIFAAWAVVQEPSCS